jgi:hypothetical protein
MIRSKYITRTIILLCLLLTSINSLAAQSKQEAAIPDTTVGKQLKDWLRVFASGNQD